MGKTHSIIHPASGIDLAAPGGVQALLGFHRCHFGNARMEDNGGDGGDTGAAGGNNSGGGSGAGDQHQTGAQGDNGQSDSDGEKLGQPGIKALNAERDARKQAEKDLTDARARVKELEDANKTDGEKRTERLQELEQSDRQKDTTITGLQAELIRYRVAAAEGLDLEAAERLRGTTEEEIRADAKAFAAKFGSRRPGEVPGAGTRGSDTPHVEPGLGRMRSAYSETSK